MNQKIIMGNTIHQPVFDENHTLHKLSHFLPAQASLKDFIHHNTLHAFQDKKFDEALVLASEIFGYKVFLTLKEYRKLYKAGKISEVILNQVISENKGDENIAYWKTCMLQQSYDISFPHRIGKLREIWKNNYYIDFDVIVHPLLFRVLCSYLDQGVSVWNFPVHDTGFLASIKELERNSFISFFNSPRAKSLLLSDRCEIYDLLKILVDDENLFESYLFDQQFAHQGWSGMVSVVEQFPETLLDSKIISLKELITFELLLEIDALDSKYGTIWGPLKSKVDYPVNSLFNPVEYNEYDEVILLWHKSFEWTYYNEVLSALLKNNTKNPVEENVSFQAFFCIDDRECSLRRYIENEDKNCQTFATPGHFNCEFYYQPEDGKFVTKLCPAPVTPRYLIKESGNTNKKEKEHHFNKRSHSLFTGFLIAQTLGFWAALKLFYQIFKPSSTPASADSFKHMDKFSSLTIACEEPPLMERGLQVGYNMQEMADRVEGVLRTTGLIRNFASIIYVIGHGSSSVNNPHYAAYDCGACSGRPGSVNSRVFCYMANLPEVRSILTERNIYIPEQTQFIGGLHDTCRDDFIFFDEEHLNIENKEKHKLNQLHFSRALDKNAKERSRRFDLMNTRENPDRVHQKIRLRSVSLFEPRPELNHATNALCIIGKRNFTHGIFLDRRAFMNSYDYETDPDGTWLLPIINAAAPVCGGINLEYYFSRVDNQKLGAGSKLPHNVMGLFGVANGIDGDLRPGLPKQMIEIHDPVRLLMVVEQKPDVVLHTIQKNPATYEWFINEWIHLLVFNPERQSYYRFQSGGFIPFSPVDIELMEVADMDEFIESSAENIQVMIVK